MKHWETKTFILFAAACALAWLYAQFYVLECKGLSLEEMDQKMAEDLIQQRKNIDDAISTTE
ncbi:hypothetical protein PIROE2DRAFT_16781 [Piromyces sp. E2]|nr:hypothetical protein PIROE2DRAFT_16781 [Piromyces sp. E2]|eukprot:OUM58055.1 hypothetical protein PIROE2DRAFT_16781 [Piromyces sp. E2]